MGKSKKSARSGIAQGQPKVVCFFCGAEFAEEGLLILHQQTKHFKCSECSGFQGGRCPTHGCRHKCLVTLSCHWKKDHKGELKTIPGAKEGRDDAKKFWRVHGTAGTPEDFMDNMPAPIPADVGPPIPESELPPIPNQPPMPSMPFPELLAEWSMPMPTPGLQGDGAVGGSGDAEVLAPSNESETPDFARQVQEWMAAKKAEDEAVARSQEQALPTSLHTSPASFSSDAFKSEPPTTLANVHEDCSGMEPKQSEPPEFETKLSSQERRSRSRDIQDIYRRSRSRDRPDRAAHPGQDSRSWDGQNSRRAIHERDWQEERMQRPRSRERGRDGNAGRNAAIKIIQGHIPSRIWLQNLMGPFGRLEYSHTGNRLNPENDPPWVLFATTGAAEDAMKAIGTGAVLDGHGVPIKAEWKKLSQKGKGKGDHKEISSRDIYRERQGARDDRRRPRRSRSRSRSSRRIAQGSMARSSRKY